MILHSCAVFDLKTQSFGRPFFVHHPAQAVRSFQDELRKSDSELGAHPEDYELWVLASFDDAEGVFKSSRQRLVAGANLIVKE